PPVAKRDVYRLLKRLNVGAPYRSLERVESRSHYSTVALRTLGPDAKPAIPELNRIMTNPPSSSKSGYASARPRASLAFIGEPALPYLLADLTNSWPNRYELPGTFAFMAAQGVNLKPAIPILIALLKDGDQATSESSARALARIGYYQIETD